MAAALFPAESTRKKVVDIPSGTVIPIPMHGKYVQEAYIKELKDLFAEIVNRNREVK